MAEDNLQYDTEEPEIQVDDHIEQEQQGPGDPPSKVLWEKMVKNKRYSFSYDDFQKEYNSKESIAKLHKELRGVGAKVVPINDFYAKYFPDLAGAKSSTTKPAQNEKPTAAGAQQQPVTSQTPKLAPQVFEKPITSQQYAPMDGIPAYGSPEYKKIKAAEAEKQSKQVAQQRAFQEFETAYDKFNIAKKNVDNGNDPDEQGVLSNGKPYSKAIGGKGVIENVSDFIIGHIVPSEAVKQEQERSRMQSKLLSYSSANEKALKTAQVYIDDITNEALKGYPRLSKISSVDGVHTPDPIKIRQYINNRAESAGFSKDGPVYDILNSKITAGVEYAIKKPTIEKNANEISKKETGKSIQELVSAEQQAIIQSAADINSKAKLQAETLAQKTISANKAEAQDLFNTKYKPLYDERNAISEQAASAFEKQFAHLIKDGKFIGSPQEYEMYNQQLAALQAIDDENKALTDSWSKELFKEQGRIASKYNKQYMAGISALEASTKKELAKKNEELKAFKVSPGLLTKINRYYEEAYKKTVTDEDAAKAPKGFLQTLSAFDSMFTHNFLDAMANYAGRMGLKGIESVFAAGANEFNPQQIEMNKFSDFLSPYKVIGSAATMGGRMGPAIAAGAITGAVTKNTGMAFRAFMAGANEWLTENTDNAHSTYKDVLAETGDPAKAENAAQKQYEAGMINLPLYGLGWMPFFSKSFNKLPLVAKIVAGTAIETGTELPTEFSQNLQEESIKKTGDWKNMLDYASWEKAKNTFYNIVPLSLAMGGGGHVVTHFADKVTYNQKVDALVQATEIGGASASQQDQYAFNLVKIGDTKLAKAVLVGLHQSGHITDKELNRLNATVDKAKSITESAEKLGMNEGEQRIYAALNYQFEEAKANMATEKDPIAREAWKLKAANAQQNITNFAATKQGDYAIVTYADGGQSVFSHEEINNALSTPVVAKSLKKGTLKIEVFGKEKEALAEKIKQTTEAEKKSTASPSVADDETENGNDDFSVEKVEAADGITHYLPTSSTSGYFKDEQGEDISFTTEQEAKDFLSKQPKAQVPTLSTQSKKETLTKEQDEAKQRAELTDIEAKEADIERRKQALRDLMKATGDDIFMLGVEDGTFMGESLLNMNENGDVVLTRYADSEEGLTKGKGKTKNLKDIAGQFGGEQIATSGIEGGAASFTNRVVGEYHIPLQELIDLIKSEDVVFAGLGNKEFVLSPHIADKYLTKINGKQINAKYDGSKSKDVESAIDGGKSQQPGQLQQNEVEIPNTPEAIQLDEERKKAIAPLQAVAGGKATHTIQLPQRGKNTATILQNGREAGSIILTPEEQSLNDQKEAGREAGLVTDEEYNEWHKGFTAKVAARAIDATNKQYAKKQEALVNNPPSFLQRVKNLDLEAITDPIGRVLKYFALGGKINTNFVKEQYGGKDERIRQSTSTEEQRRSMFSLLAKDAPNIEELAEQLEAEANQHNDGNSRLDTRDYVSAIEEVLSSHQSPASAAKELWEKYSPEATEAEIAKLWEQKGGSQTQEESAPMEETEVRQPLTINGEEISFSADNSNPQTASQEPKLLTPNDPKFKRLQKAINRFLSKIKGYSTEVLHGQDFQKLVDWAKRQQDITDNVKQIFETEESDKEPKYFRRPNGTIYGIKVGTKIYLNGDKLNLETPAHEAGHIFRDWAKENAPDLYKAATKLMSRPNKYREMVLANETYKEQIRQMKANGATAEQINEFIADEALAHMIGDRAAKIVENRSQFVQWLKDLWESIKLSMPGAKDFENKTLSDFYKMTWEQFGNAATERILSGRALETRQSKNSSTSSAPQYMTLPDGRKAKLLPEVTNGFYSPIEKKLLDEKAENLSANKWLERLGKGDEMVWTGLKDFLESKKPNEQVKKSELQDFMKDNRIEVVEVVKSAEEKQVKYKQLSEMPNAIYGYAERFIETGDKKFLSEIEKEGYKVHYDNNGEVDYFTKEGKTYLKDTTKFSQYQLEGEKENYREILVTMPNDTKGYYALRKEFSDYSANKVPRKSGEDIVAYQDRYKKELENDKDYQALRQRMIDADKKQKEDFKSSHFDEPNILVHLRMNTRTDAEGNKVLFLEEVQSDFAQLARKKGFKSGNINELKTELAEAEKEYEKLDFKNLKLSEIWQTKEAQRVESLKEKISQEENGLPQAPFVTDTNAWTKLGLKVALKEAVAQGAERIAWTTGSQQNERYDLSKQIDGLVYQKNTDGTFDVDIIHQGIGLPRVDKKGLTLQQVEANYGKDVAKRMSEDIGDSYKYENINEGNIAEQVRINGEVAADFIDKLEDSGSDAGGYIDSAIRQSAKAGGDKQVGIDWLNNAESKWAEKGDAKRVKDIQEARKILTESEVKFNEGGAKVLRGENLRVGGKGMKGFYGSPSEGKLGIVGEVAKSLFKQEPKTIKIMDKETPSIFNRYNEKKNELAEKEKRINELYDEINNSKVDLPKQAREYNLLVDEAQDLRKEIKDIERTSPNALKQATSTSTQHSITITPEMREQVQEGQPLFMAQMQPYLDDSELIKDKDGNVTGIKPEVAEAIRKERNRIEAEAKANGTYHKAPNGKPSKLTESQWVTVRTERFKRWFGDWESAADLLNLGLTESEIIKNLKIKNYATEVIANRKEIRRLSQEAERGRKRGGIRNVEATIILETGGKRNGQITGRENQPNPLNDVSKVVDENGEPLVVYHGSPNGVFTVFDLSKRGTRSTGAYNESRALHFTDNLKTAIAYSESYKNKPVKYTVNGVEKIINPTDTRPSAKEYEVFLNIRNAEDVGASRNITKEKITDAIKSGFDGIFADMGNGREFVAFNPNQIKSATSNAGTFSNETGDIRFMAENEKSVSQPQDNHEAAKKKTQGNRIEKSPLTGGKRKEIRHIIRDFKNAAKTRIFYTKVGRRAAGTYNSSEGAIRLRYAGDLDTTAHEAGHDIDDRYKVIEAILKNPAARAELVPFVASPAASKPPKGHPNPQNYLQREGFAEWLRAFIVNPDEAKAQAPEIYKIYEAQVHDNMKKAVHHFSNDVRTFAGLEGIDQLLSNVELTPETKSFFDRFKDKNHEGVFHISWVDKIKINMLNSLQAFDKAWNIAKGLKGIDEVLPENDPTILVRLLYGFDGKFGDILETGMINSKNEVLEDANGNAKNLDWLLEPLDRYNEKTIKKEQEYTIAFMVAERTLELSKRFGRESILSGIGGGLFKDIETAQAALDEINALPPAQKARIEEAARRYREFANDILLYMVDKGRLSQEQYDAIKKENVQYVAMQRIIDQEPGTELEVFTMNGNSIGSVAKPVHNIQGSSRTIINPYSSLLDGLYRSIKEADRNEILVAFTNMVSHVRSMGDGEVIPFSDIAIKGKPGDKNTQVVYHNGKPEYWIFQQDIHEAIKGLNEEAEGLLMKYGKIPGTILRETITKFPVFAARNFIRDTHDRIIKSSDSNLLDLVGNSAHWKDIARFGGLNSGFYMRDRASYYGLMKESMRRLAKNKNTIVLSGEGMKRVWDRYEKALQTSETINRVAEYRGAFREAKKKGMDDYNAGLYAASRARNLIDFAEAGVIMRQLNKLIPFSNAAVQGLRSAVNRAIEDPGGFAIRTGVYSVLPAVMLWMWNHRKDDDDDKENEYENLPAYQRDMYHNLKIGKNKWLSIPKPYELSLVSSGIDRGMSLFFGKNKNAFQGYGGTVIQSVMPLDESSMFGPFRPIYEGISNYDVFRQKNIVPIYENDLDLSLRHTETASLLGQWLQSASNIDARKIDHFIQGQFGYFGKAAMKLSNINREDGGKSFDITDLGFFKESPGYNSPDVQNLLNYAKRWGLTQNIDFKDIKALNQAIFDAKTDEEKEAAKKELITHSRLLLLQWKAEDKAKQKQDKFTEKQDTKSD